MIIPNNKDYLEIYTYNIAFCHFSMFFMSGFHILIDKMSHPMTLSQLMTAHISFLSSPAKHLHIDESLSQAGLVLAACRIVCFSPVGATNLQWKQVGNSVTVCSVKHIGAVYEDVKGIV